MNVLDLFSGIGGFSLGLERAGMRTVAFCEIEPFCRRVLAKHWPHVPCYDDVRSLTADRLRADGIAADVICGGFPCQDISLAGKGAGIDGERSGLWSEYARIIGNLRPRYVIVENVAALLGRGLDRVLGDLAALGYDAEWHCIPAAAVGAPHIRDRVWIIAHPRRSERRAQHRACGRTERDDGLSQRQKGPGGLASIPVVAADANGINGWTGTGREDWPEVDNGPDSAANASQMLGPAFFREQSNRTLQRYWTETWPERLEALRGVDDGLRGSVDALASLGNTVTPAIPEIIGRAILAAEKERR